MTSLTTISFCHQSSMPYGSKHIQRNHKKHQMSDFFHKKLNIYLLPFETMVIMAHYSFLTHECQENQIKNPFDLFRLWFS